MDRRAAVLEAALLTFARFGYRKTSMDAIALGARISRPGLYFLFSSKDELFRAAVTQALNADLLAAEGILNDTARRLPDRLLDAFDRWAGRYVGPMTRDIPVLIEDNPELLGSIIESAPMRFAELITHAIAAEATQERQAQTTAVAQTLISASIGIKHQVDDRSTYLKRLDIAIGALFHQET
ncbi:MAG: TetR/AcrR family transcriptional regulator [Nakamurella sp.]